MFFEGLRSGPPPGVAAAVVVTLAGGLSLPVSDPAGLEAGSCTSAAGALAEERIGALEGGGDRRWERVPTIAIATSAPPARMLAATATERGRSRAARDDIDSGAEDGRVPLPGSVWLRTITAVAESRSRLRRCRSARKSDA